MLTLVLMSMLRLLACNAQRLLESLTGRWVDLLKGGMRGPKHTQCPLLPPFSSLPLLGIALRQINGLVLNKSFLLLSWWQSTILLSLYLFVSISSKSAGCPYKARGKTRQARDKRGRAKGGQEGARGRAGQTEVSFPKISRPGAVLVWGLR